MTIERLSLPEGVLVDRPEKLRQLIGRVLIEHEDNLIILEPGEYDLTPKSWGDNKNKYSLLVHPNGEATSQSFPINSGASIVRMQGDRVEANRINAGRVEQINAQNPVLVIAGGRNQDSGVFLYEAIFYLP